MHMFGKICFWRWLVVAAVFAIAEFAGMAAVEIGFVAPAQAQFFGDQRYQDYRQERRPRGFFQNLFEPFNSRPYERENSRPYENEYGRPNQPQQIQPTQQPSESSRPPPPRKTQSEGEQFAPTTSIVVMGDGMADWLAYGLEEVFSNSPELNIIRKNKFYSGLLRYDAKGDLDWWHVARDILAKEKANYVIMMLGVSDRESIRQKDLAKETETKVKEQQAKNEAEKKGEQPPYPIDNSDEIVAPNLQRGKNDGVVEFRSDQWVKIYSRRIDETIAALKSKGVPVFWVGLPSIRGTRSTADATYLNDLYRSRAERAGIVYIDVWDGFVDEAGKYSNYGPDYEGQMRRLRSSEGVFFTKYGVRKLAYYVERELRRYMSNRMPVALPSEPHRPLPSEQMPVERPLAGPTVLLTGTPTSESDELLGGAGGGSAHSDDIAAKVLLKGEPVAAPPGRADNFVWPLGSETKLTQPVEATPPAAAQPKALPTAAARALASAPVQKKKEERKSGSVGKTTQNTMTKPSRSGEITAESRGGNMPRPPLPIGPASGPFGWVR